MTQGTKNETPGDITVTTIQDVAREAGVSISTVSYALSGKRTISENTRKRVEEAAQRLNYFPRAAARALAARHNEIIAVTTPVHSDTDRSAHMAFTMKVATEARKHNYDTLLLVQDDAVEGMRRAAETALVDGIVALDVDADDERTGLARTMKIPVVFVGLPSDTSGLTCVDLDFDQAIRVAIDRLIAAGHRTIGLISHNEELLKRGANFPLRIEHAFRQRCAETHIASAVINPRSPDAHDAVNQLLTTLPNTTGIILSSSHSVGASLLPALAARGLSVPHDISVIEAGTTPDASTSPLPFDSLPLDPNQTCPVALDLLVDLIEHQRKPGDIILVPPRYEDRHSVAPATDRHTI
ncbi:MAG: LacI family transcriptional regulator [Ancrocorticia sp.]|jgi:DNA-binding LacI/PurR family transcriptional regulator|nr:LacI family transcriptional regulator [Ancrocorticia sp.]